MPPSLGEILFAGDRLKSARYEGKFATVLDPEPDDHIPAIGFIKLGVYRERDGTLTEPIIVWTNPDFMGDWVKDQPSSDDPAHPPPHRYDPLPFQNLHQRDR